MVRYSTGGIPSILKGADNPMHLRHGQNDTRSDRTTEKRVRLDVDEIVDIAAENARRAHLYMGAKENLEYDAHSAYIRPGVDRQTIPGPHSPRRVSKSQVVKMRVASGPLLPAKSLRHLPERSIPARKCGSASLGPHGHNLQVSLNDVIAAAPEAATPSNPVLLRGNHRHEKEFADNVCLAKTRPSESKKSLLSTVSARQAVDLDRPLPPRPIVTNTPPFIKRKAVPRIPPQDSARISLSCSSPETKDDQSASHKLCVFSGLTTSANRPHPPSSRHGQQTPNTPIGLNFGKTRRSMSGSSTDIRGIDDVESHGSVVVRSSTSIVDDSDIDDNFQTLFRMLETDFPQLYDVELELDSVRFVPIVTQEPIDRMIWPRQRHHDGDKPSLTQRLPEMDASGDAIPGSSREINSKVEELLSNCVSWETFPSAKARALPNRSERALRSFPHVPQVGSIPTRQETSEIRSPALPGHKIPPPAGTRVREAVQTIEQKTFSVQPSGLSTPVQRIGAILDRPSLVDSAELTRASKELMEKARQNRLSKRYIPM